MSSEERASTVKLLFVAKRLLTATSVPLSLEGLSNVRAGHHSGFYPVSGLFRCGAIGRDLNIWLIRRFVCDI